MDCIWTVYGCLWDVCAVCRSVWVNMDCMRTGYILCAASRLVYGLYGLYMDCVWLYTAVYELYAMYMDCVWLHMCPAYSYLDCIRAGGSGGVPPRDEGGISIARLLGARRANIR